VRNEDVMIRLRQSHHMHACSTTFFKGRRLLIDCRREVRKKGLNRRALGRVVPNPRPQIARHGVDGKRWRSDLHISPCSSNDGFGNPRQRSGRSNTSVRCHVTRLGESPVHPRAQDRAGGVRHLVAGHGLLPGEVYGSVAGARVDQPDVSLEPMRTELAQIATSACASSAPSLSIMSPRSGSPMRLMGGARTLRPRAPRSVEALPLPRACRSRTRFGDVAHHEEAGPRARMSFEAAGASIGVGCSVP